VRQILLNKGENSLTAVNTVWLDGLSLQTTSPGQLMLIFTRMNLINNGIVIKTLRWNSGLWGTVTQSASVGDGIPHFIGLVSQNEEHRVQPGDEELDVRPESVSSGDVSALTIDGQFPLKGSQKTAACTACTQTDALTEECSVSDSGDHSSSAKDEHISSVTIVNTVKTAANNQNKVDKKNDAVSSSLGIWRNHDNFHQTILRLKNVHPALYMERD
jgi:hypothetical protein